MGEPLLLGLEISLPLRPPPAPPAPLFFFLTIFLAVKHCERDPDTGEVLWFAAPPVNVARAAQAKHSLTYLHYLAERKRKREEEEEEGKELGKDGDRDGIDGTTGEEEEGGEEGEGAGASGNGERKRRITMVEVLRGISPLSLAT